MRLYTVTFTNVALSAAQDLFGLLATANMAVRIRSIELGQKTLTSWEAKELKFVRHTGTAAAGSGGNAFTPLALRSSDAAATFTARINDTAGQTQAGGADQTLFSREWEFLNGFYWGPQRLEECPIIKPSEGFALQLGTAPSAPMTGSGVLTAEELF
jgi:hypothetical protein